MGIIVDGREGSVGYFWLVLLTPAPSYKPILGFYLCFAC